MRGELERRLIDATGPSRDHVLEMAAATAAYAHARGGTLGEDETAALLEAAADVQLTRGTHGMIEHLLAVPTIFADVAAEAPAPEGAINVAACAAALLARLWRAAGIAADEAVVAWESINRIDDVIVRRRGAYPQRSIVLSYLRHGLGNIERYCRHVDLVVRLKWALELTAREDDVFVAMAIDELRALVPALDARIGVTHDGPGPGCDPAGRPVHRRRVAEIERAVRSVTSFQRYRSLPRLRAQVLRELGRALTGTSMSSSRAALAEAFRCFEHATVAYTAVSAPRDAAACAIAGVECLEWLTAHVAPGDLRAHFARVIEHGHGVHAQVRAAFGLDRPSIDDPAITPLLFARNACQRAEWWSRLYAVPRGGDAMPAIRAVYGEMMMQLQALVSLAPRAPWSALRCGEVAIEQLVDLLEAARVRTEQIGDEAAIEAEPAARRETAQHYVQPEILSALVVALAGALEAPAADAHDDPIGAPSPDVWLRRPSVAQSWRRLHGALATVLVAAAIRDGLSAAQWNVVARAFANVRPLALPVHLLLQLRERERAALAASVASGLAVVELVAYVLQRVEQLERHVVNPVLSQSERLLLAGWVSGLIEETRRLTGDLAEVPARFALALLDRGGATSFRAECALYRYVQPTTAHIGRVDDAPLPPLAAVSPAQILWAEVLQARNLVDFWSRYRMIVEAGRADPRIEATFSVVVRDPGTLLLAAPLDTPLDELTAAWGVTPDEIERSADRVVVRLRPRDLAHAEAHLDPVRRRLESSLRALARAGQIRPRDFVGVPWIDSDDVARWLAVEHAAVVFPGVAPAPLTALAVMTAADGDLRIESVPPPGDVPGRDVLLAAIGLDEAIGRDLRDAGVASWSALAAALATMESVLAPWARALAARLENAGVQRVVFMLRGLVFPRMPWELVEVDGVPFGERFETTWAYTLGAPPSRPTGPRQQTAQIHGVASSEARLDAGVGAMRTLAAAGLARAPVAGDEAAMPGRLDEVIRDAARLRLFLHGHHDVLQSDADRLTLIDAERPERRVNLHPRDLRRLPLAGITCVELWACEGAAHARALQEHGLADEPEDLTAALLVAGAERVVAARWHVPTLASALLLERFAQRVHRGEHDETALAGARRDYRLAFASEGPIALALIEGLRVSGTRDERVQVGLLLAAIDVQRRAWYGDALPASGLAPLHAEAGIAHLARWTPAPSVDAEALVPTWGEGDAAVRASEILAPYRSSASWAGWRVTVRDPVRR